MNTAQLNFHSHDYDAPIVSLSTDEYADFKPAPGQRITVGIHPWDTDRNTLSDFTVIADALVDPNLVAVGEVGIDPLRGAPVDRQYWLLGLQVKHAQAAGFPIVFHIVRRFDLLEQLYGETHPTTPWAIHGFRGKPEVAQRLIDRGIYLSLGPKFNAETARIIPDNLLLVETDEAPSDTLDDVIADVAEARGQSPDHIARIVKANLDRFFHAVKH